LENTNQTQVLQNTFASENITKLILRFGLPSIIGLLVTALYNIVDQIFIGNVIGYLGIAATNVAFPLVTISNALSLLFGVGGATCYSFQLGRGDEDRANKLAGSAMTFLILSGIALGVGALVFLTPVLKLLGATELVLPYAVPYTAIIAIGLPFSMFTGGACTYIRADGSPTYSMIIFIIGAVFNVIFDPIFLFVCDMGILGAALATTLSHILTAILAAHYLLKKRRSMTYSKKDMRPKTKYFMPICSIGFGICFSQIVVAATQIVLNNTMRHYGAMSVYGSEIPLAAVGVALKITVLYGAFIFGIVQGFQPILGYNYGAKLYSRVKQIYKATLSLSTIFSIAVFLICMIFPRQISAIFGTGDEAYFAFAVRFLRIYMIMTFLNGIQPIVYNILNSIGKVKIGMLATLSRQVLFAIPLLIVMPLIFGFEGALWATPVADVLAALLSTVLVVREFREINTLIPQQEKEFNMNRETPPQ
jgi:putative MATE family efflux protein